MKNNQTSSLADPVGLYFDADFSRYADGRGPAVVTRAAEVVLDLGAKLLLRLSKPLPGQQCDRDGIARVLADRAAFLPLDPPTISPALPSGPSQSASDDGARPAFTLELATA